MSKRSVLDAKYGVNQTDTFEERVAQLEHDISILMDISAQTTDIAICDQCGAKRTGPISDRWFHAPPINNENYVNGGDNGAYLCGMAYCTKCAQRAYCEDDQQFTDEADLARFHDELSYWLAHNVKARNAFAHQLNRDDELRAMVQKWMA